MDDIILRQNLANTLKDVLMSIDDNELHTFADALLEAKRVYVAGWGRAGNCIRILSMNCSQIGLKTHIVGDNSTPSIHEGDILVIGSGSGETDTIKILADQCKEHGAKLGLISHNRDSYIGRLADYQIYIPSPAIEDKENAPICDLLTFYQTEIMVNDILMSIMMEKKGVTTEDVIRNHNNLE